MVFDRKIYWLIGVSASLVWLLLLSITLPNDSYAADLLIDKTARLAPFPFTMQSLMWIIFFLSGAELAFLYERVRREEIALKMHLLPEDPGKMIQAAATEDIVRKVRNARIETVFLRSLIEKTALQFLSSQSISQTHGIFNQTKNLLVDRIDSDFELLRYFAWLLPTTGFIGTVVGISLALQVAGVPPTDMDGVSMRDWMGALTGDLAIAFNTTLLALTQSAIVVCFTTLLRNRVDTGLIDCEEYCLDNLVNKLYVT